MTACKQDQRGIADSLFDGEKYVESDCEDQALTDMPKTCLRFECDKAPLVRRGKFMVCSKCGGSYGEAS